MNKLKCRDIVRVITFSVALVAVLVGMLLASRQLAFENRRTLHTSYLRQTEELASGIEHIAEQLEIMGFAGSKDTRTDSAFEIWQLCSRCTENMTDLPLSEYNTEAIMTYFNQVGEYSRFLAKKDALTDGDRKTLSELCDYSVMLSEKLYALAEKLVGQKSGYSDAHVPQLDKTSYLGFNLGLDDAAKELSGITDGENYPKFEYDGQYGHTAGADGTDGTENPDGTDGTENPDEQETLADDFDIEKILSALPEGLHIITWQVSKLDGAPCVCVEVETKTQNVYEIYYSPYGKELKIVRKN